MIRIRKSNGAFAEVPDATFVEVVGADGLVITALHQLGGRTTQIMPGSPEAARYEQLFKSQNLRFKPAINLPPT